MERTNQIQVLCWLFRLAFISWLSTYKVNELNEISQLFKVNGRRIPAHIDDLELLGDLGNGTCGHVVKMRHKPSGQVCKIHSFA